MEARSGSKKKQAKNDSAQSQRLPAEPIQPLGQPPPPPAPPPPVPVGVKGVAPRLNINPRDLKLERKKLKRPDEILKQVDVERNLVFDQYKKFSYMPLVDSREYLRTLKAEIHSISFNGVEQVSDTFLFSLYHCKVNLDMLSWISLVGCYNVTDEGVYWLCMELKNMRSIQLLGCNRITERSVYYIRKMVPKLNQMYLDATSCGLVPVDCRAKMGDYSPTSKSTNEKPDIYVNGCPLISPLPAEIDIASTGYTSPYRKLVILTPESLPWSPLAILTGDKDVSLKLGLTFKHGWKPFSDLGVTDVKSSASVFNVFQIPNIKGLPELILSPGSIVMFPYQLHPKKSVTMTAKQLATEIATVLTKHDDCSFILLGLSSDKDTTDYTTKLEDVSNKVKHYIVSWLGRLQMSIHISINTNWRMAALNFMEQEALSAGQRLLRHGKLLCPDDPTLKSGAPSKTPLVLTSRSSVVSGHISVGESQPIPLQARDVQFLKEVVEVDEEIFGWNRQAFYSDKVMCYSTGLSKAGLPITSLSDVTKSHKMDGLPAHGVQPHMSKLMSYAALWGHAMYYPVVEEQPVCTDFMFLAAVLHNVFFKTAPRKCNIRCLGNGIPCWTRADLLAVGQGTSHDQMELMLRVFEKNGCLFRFAVDPWSNFQHKDSSVYVLYGDFPTQPHLPLEQFWSEESREVNQKDKYYIFSPGVPQSFFPNLLRHVLKLGSAALVWKNGIVIQKGYQKILVEKVNDHKFLPVVLVQVRIPKVPEGAGEGAELSSWHVLKLYTTIVDHLMLKYKLSAAKAVPCMKCLYRMSRYKIIADNNFSRFFLEHLVRCGDHFDVSCKGCAATTVGVAQIGPAIELSDLVPQHKHVLFKDRLYKRCGPGEEDEGGLVKQSEPQAEQPRLEAEGDKEDDSAAGDAQTDEYNLRSLPFNRCLMCENCTTEGMDCKVNLRQGTGSWYCGCGRDPGLCLGCGMCMRCYLYLKTIVASVQPLFEIPKSERFQQDEMIALDEVKVTEKGSIVGFLENDCKLYLYGAMLSPGYIDHTKLTILKEGHMSVVVKMAAPDTQLIRYESSQGSIFVNNKEVLGKDVSRVLSNGQTVSLKSSLAVGNFDKMVISLAIAGVEIFSYEADTQLALVSLHHVTEGLFVQIETPNKFRPKNKVNSIREKFCGIAVQHLPCAIEAVLTHLQKNVEAVCFGGRGISLSGSAVLALPTPLSLENLKHPRLELFDEMNYHHLCLTWNPFTGKKPMQHNLEPLKSKDPSYWQLQKLIHLIDSEGRKVSRKSNLDDKSAFLMWAWHQMFASFPEVLLPETLNHLVSPGVYTKETELQVKEGLRSIVRLGCWMYLNKAGLGALQEAFKGHDQKFKGKFLTAKSKLVATALTLVELQNDLKGPKLTEVYSRFNASLCLYLCEGHAKCLKMKEGLTEIPPELYGPYSVFISFVDLGGNEITSLPEEFFQSLPNLVDLSLADNFIAEIPGSISVCKKLNSLSMAENDLVDLPATMVDLPMLTSLNLGNNRFVKVPAVITKLTTLTTLDLNSMMLTELPEDIGNLTELKTLYLNGNCLTKLPASFTKLTELVTLGLMGVQWMSVKATGVVSYNQFRSFLSTSRIVRYMESNSEDKDELFRMFDENANGVLDLTEVGKLNAVIFNLFPRFGNRIQDPQDDSNPSGFPMEILSLTNLKTLHLTYHGFTRIPKEISQLQNLVTLMLSHNPSLLSIPAELSLIPGLKKTDLDDCPSLKTPPREIREKGFQSTYAYLQRLMSGAIHSKRTKLMLVGLGGAGKTSLVKALLSDKNKADLQHGEAITDGIDIKSWTVKHKGNEITYNVWDFAGQTVYYNTHQFFLSTNRAVYILLWNVRLGHEHAGLDFWLSSVSVQAPDTPIFVVGSHIDQVSKTELPLEEMKQRFPQIVGFHFISNFTGQGIAQLKEDLFNVTLQQQYMGENIPAVWLTFEKNIDLLKPSENIISYEAIGKIANRSGIFEESEIFQAIQFLHDLGSVQHFPNEYLKSKVVINPQWIVDVMACVVSVKTKAIQNGRLNHSDLKEIWSNEKQYPKSLHSWLLRLTEEFDLTFALNDEPVNLVPCLMTEKKPEFVWEELEKDSDIKENKMVYKFEYLPAGLFNRGQVRLHNLSDSSLIWKKGSFLRKNVHVALLQQTRDRELVVAVQGPRPENILFLVHEVFEGLIAESYNGVKYDFSMPCPDCQKMNVKDCHMFDASTIRRALDMKAPFLQCVKYFHTISCADLQTMLPPDTHSDFDAHLVYCVQGLKHLRQDLATDIFISYCALDGQLDKNSYITPSRVVSDLVNRGFKVWYREASEPQSMDEMAKALIDSSVFLAFVSANYAHDEECNNIFKYARLTLRKNIVVVALGDNFDWKQSKLGILLSDEVFVNMIKPKLEFYDSKFEELLKSLSGRTRVLSEVAIAKPAVFISYTWVNSAQAVALGTREIPGALGYGDPRELKTYIENHGISCWLDVERVGMNGLFDDIAEGLLSAKVVIVCVSDEYASSSTCQIEFRYAANTLKLPIIIVVVGNGDMWRGTEVGLMSVNYPIVNMQEKSKKAKHKLLRIVEEYLGQGDDVDGVAAKKSQQSSETHKNLSYLELFELAQRKLLRQLTFYVENQDLDVYPRLFVLDFAGEMEKEREADAEKKLQVLKEKVDDIEENREVGALEGRRKSGMSRHSSQMLPAYKLERYCVYTLCEHDEGWHSVAEPILLPENFGINDLDKYSPYLSRVTAVMKYNKKLQLKCHSDEVGQDYVQWLEKSPEATMSDYQNVYHMLREMIMEADTERLMGKLSRCHLSNGKTIWLCPSHQASMKVTCLSSDDKTTTHSKEQDKQINDSMLVGLKTMDFQTISSQFKSSGNAPRSRIPNRFSSQQYGKGKKTKGKLKRMISDETETRKTSGKDIPSGKPAASNLEKKAQPPQPTDKPQVPTESKVSRKPQPTSEVDIRKTGTVESRETSKQEPSGQSERRAESGTSGPPKQMPREMPIPKRPTRQESRESLQTPRSQGELGQYQRPRTGAQKGKQTSRACVLS